MTITLKTFLALLVMVLGFALMILGHGANMPTAVLVVGGLYCLPSP